MGKGRIAYFGFSGAVEIFEAEAVPFRKKNLSIDNHLRNIAIKEGLASLSSPMVGECWKAIVLLKLQFLRGNKWNAYANLRHSSFDTYLNPKVIDQAAQTLQEWEECCGYPGIRLMIPRAKKVMVRFQEQVKMEDKSCELVDFSARLFLHEMDHIESIDPLKLATKMQIIQPQLKEKYNDIIQPLFDAMIVRRQPGDNIYQRSQQFNELRREIAFCITDHYRK